jgi:hypothetical protein
MKINFTKKQYWDLMRAVYMSDWMANAICEGDMKEDTAIKNIRNHVFSFAKEMGYEDYAEYDEEMKTWYATLDMDDDLSTRALIERYNDQLFWDELPDRLGERDFFRTYTKDEISKMSKDDRFMKRMECEIQWEEELENFGLDRLAAV